MIFKSRKDSLFKIVFTTLSILFIFIFFSIVSKKNINTEDLIPLIIIIVVSIFIYYSFNATYYEITNTLFKYKSGFIKGDIPLKEIHSITKNTTMWVGLKPATAKNGLIIKYNKYDEIYISPKTNDTFIIEILKHNPNITITS